MRDKPVIGVRLHRSLIKGGVLVLLSGLTAFPGMAQVRSDRGILPCTSYERSQDWIFALLPQERGMLEYGNAVLRAMRKLNNTRQPQPVPERKLPLRNQYCRFNGKVGIAIWNFLDQKEREVAIKEINNRSLTVIFPDGKVMTPNGDINNRCPPGYRC